MKLLFRKQIFLALFVIINTQLTAAEKILTYAVENDLRSVDPRYAVDANSQYLMDLTHCSLINFDENGQTIASLATSWKWLDSKTIEFKIKSGVKFSDGSVITAEDVKATYDFFKLKDLKDPSPFAGAFARIDRVETKDSNVKFTLTEPDVSFVQNFMIGVLPAKLAKGPMLTGSDPQVGCGPFKLTSADVTGLHLEKNAHYSLGAIPKLDKINILIVKDEQTRYAKLQKGELDLVQNGIGRDKIAAIAKEAPQLNVIKRLGLNTSYLGFNMRDKVLANAKVRKAISQAINRDQIIEFVLRGMATKAKTMLLPEDPYLAKDLPEIKFDVAASKKLLDEAGFKDPDGEGKQARFEVTYTTTTDTTRVTIAQAIASQLSKIGVKVNVQSQEWGKFKQDVEKGLVQIWSLNWVGFKDPDIYRHAFASESFPPNGGNRGFYSNASLDKLFLEARAETKPDKRKLLYAKIQSMIADESPYAFLWHEEIFAIVNRRVKNYRVYADGRLSALATVDIQ